LPSKKKKENKTKEKVLFLSITNFSHPKIIKKNLNENKIIKK
jgi:hypothetical protein